MKARLYDGGKKWTVDRYSLYFPYPKWAIKKFNLEEQGITGTYVGCSVNSSGSVVRCCWDDWYKRHGYCSRLGKKVPLDSLGEEFHKWALHLERLWNDALKYDDEKHWDLWNNA